MTATLADYADVQTARLQSEKNLKAIDSGIALAASAHGTIRLLNVVTLPRLHSAIDALTQSAGSLNRLVANADREISGNLLPTANRTLDAATETLSTSREAIRQYGQTAQGINKSITELSIESKLTIEEARALIGSKEVKETLAGLAGTTTNLAATTKNLESITANTAEASKRMPGIADDVQRVTHTTSKFRKAILIGQLAAVIAAFR